MTTTATLGYSVPVTGLPPLSVAALMASAPLPLDMFAALGCRVLSDATIAGPPVQRTVMLSLLPVSTATATAVLTPSNDSTGSPIMIVLGSSGSGYVVAPTIKFTANDKTGDGAKAVAFMNVSVTNLFRGGMGYNAASTLKVAGHVKQGGHQAVLTPTIAGGVLTGVFINDPGSGYTSAPSVTLVDPTGIGSGAIVFALMGVDSITLFDGGDGYQQPPTIVFEPAFKTMFPDGSDQTAPFREVMTNVLSKVTMSPVTALAPVVV